jgi:hypothetical protein
VAPADEKDGAEENSEPDWGKIISDLLYQTSMNYTEIMDSTILVIEEIRRNAGENISLRYRMPGMFGVSSSENNQSSNSTEKDPKLSQFFELTSAFNGAS